MAEFQYNNKSIFLTYPQCPITKEEMLEHLKERARPVATNQLFKACIGQEKHEDGGLHLHICAWYTNPLRFRKPDHMDIKAPDGTWYHPNIRDR